jgi:mannose-6-phosphate isomerase-like protein (cupin superfamily)
MRPPIVRPADRNWITRPHEPGEPARHVAELSEALASSHVRANVWRYEPGAWGRRHRHATQEETFVVLSGTLSIYLGEPPVRHDVPAGGAVNVPAGTAVQSANHGDCDLVTHIYGYPAETVHAELLASAEG